VVSVPEIFDSLDYGPAPEDAAYVYEWLQQHAKGFGHFINGQFTKPGRALFDSKNPAKGTRLAKLTQGTKADVKKAVKAAETALESWSARPGHERAKHLYALARIVQKEARFLSVLDTLDNGKPIRETRDIDIPLVARHFYHHAGWAQILDASMPGAKPLGVVGQIIPWNFPLLMLAWKVAPALAAGNTVVLKPAEYTSLSALYFAQLAKEVGLPDGVLNIVTGDGATGEHIVNDKDIAKIAFTGSTSVGKSIAAATAGSGKKLGLELGGKSPYIVFDDADLDSAVEGLVDAIFFNQGEVCCAGSRLLVQEGVESQLVQKLRARLSRFRIGDPLDKAIDMGALADPVQVVRVEQMIADAAHDGATLWQPQIDCPKGGCYIRPTLLLDVDQASKAVQDEIFGPVLTIQSFRTLKEAADLANNTRYGLAASIWSENIGRAHDMASRIKAGVVWINTANQFDAAVGFGGYKESGYGREGGLEGLRAYLTEDWAWQDAAPQIEIKKGERAERAAIDQTPKNYVGGKQARPDGGRTRAVYSAKGTLVGRVGEGNRKDIRNAVEAANKAQPGWAAMTGHQRAQILYYLAENLSTRAGDFTGRLSRLTGATSKAADKEVTLSISRLFSAAAWADKFDGAVHNPPKQHITLALNEPQGVIGIACPDQAPLLAFITLTASAISAGNTVVAIPSQAYSLLATDFYQVLETSDVPGGVLNIITGSIPSLTKTLSEHDAVDGLWVHADGKTCAMAERAGAVNMKRMWCSHGKALDWANPYFDGDALLRQASEVKNIWLPYGE
jgi:aldehyde dehydrogenase (NAD+)